MEKEQYITEILNSLCGIKKTEGNSFLHTKVLAKLEKTNKTEKLPLKLVYVFATCFVMLLAIHIFWWDEFTNQTTNNSTTTSIANEYDLTSIDY